MPEAGRNRSSTPITFGYLLSRLNDPVRSNVRKLEKLMIKEVHSTYGVKFNKTCIEEDLLPSYTDIRTNDPGVRYNECTLQFRREVLHINLKKCEDELVTTNARINEIYQTVRDSIEDPQLRETVFEKLHECKQSAENETFQRTTRKLNGLYGGLVVLPEKCERYINISSHQLNSDQKEILSLGPKFHYKKKFDPLVKKIETELLYDSILRLADKNIISVHENLKPQLLAEATRNRDYSYSRVVTKKLLDAANDLKVHESMIVRNADKANCFVVMDKKDYTDKLDAILSDDTKFKALSRNPINQLKTEVNKLIKDSNQQSKQKLFEPLIGDFKTGYIYGTVKTHKNGNPLRPIISQIPTPVYTTAKTLNRIISPYLPAKYQINSTDDFLNILRTCNPRGKLASLDVEALFTNVPIGDTIDIVCRNVYNSPTIPPPPINEATLRKLLLCCTTGCPFTNHDGKIYTQCNGVAMGSPLGVTLASFYMVDLENKVFQNDPSLKPSIYVRYVDDCFMVVKSDEHLQQIVRAFKENSVLNFTTETEIDKKINFLDVHVNAEEGCFTTSVYKKETNKGIYIHARSECPDRYKINTIKNMINRTKKICSPQTFHQSITLLKQAFVNNGYSNTEFDKILNNYSTTTSLNNNISPPSDGPFNTDTPAGKRASVGMGASAGKVVSANFISITFNIW